ncbi:MAG TPA: alpha/beta fold hydrolase [Candidatus Polarisedimenticolaceae bacterium]|nr:alpha/beta fold hydrolase [Candidatus Polarisedimenticolaceae bacterium]
MTPLIAAAVIVMAAGAHQVTINGVPIAYHVYGKGPVVIAHAGGPGAQWDILRMRAVEEFATVVYIEPVGTGASGRLDDPNGYTIDRYVKDVEGLRAVLGIDRFVLLGHSHGGFVAQAYALAYPERLRGLILYDTSPTTGPVWQRDVEANLAWFQDEPWFAEAKAALAAETTAKDDDEMTAVFRREMPLYFADWTGHAVRYEPYRAAVRFAVAPGRAGTDPSAPGQVGVAPVFDVVKRLGEIKVPTLILSGTKDFVCSARFGRVLHEGIHDSRLVLLSRSGHMGHIEEPQAFAAAVREYLVEIARPRTP